MLPGRGDGEELFARSTLVDHAHDMQCNAVDSFLSRRMSNIRSPGTMMVPRDTKDSLMSPISNILRPHTRKTD